MQQGRILALIGPNGAGKSTLLLTMAGLLKPQQGKIYYQGMPVENRADLLHYAPECLRCFSGAAAY
ncbi:MAG: ATP-binding cassette domain-containing protein [Candidatus Moduliflexus flocculans]|nr:ATP-binding cassette domain-containing protein [Candidatus Moduliflexus flocculans]